MKLSWTMFPKFLARFLCFPANLLFISVVLDESGGSKGFGFIRFGNETEQQTALTTMQGIAGLGGKPIKVNQPLALRIQIRNIFG